MLVNALTDCKSAALACTETDLRLDKDDKLMICVQVQHSTHYQNSVVYL
jgi:hypothetical protein